MGGESLKTRLLILFFLAAGAGAVSQKPYLYFNRITTAAGLSHNKVNCIAQDRRGFMWIGTEDGLNRYDGRFFTTFRHIPGDSASISGNIVSDILEDGDGVLWIATADGGLTKYDYRLPPPEQFRQFKHLPDDSTSIPVNSVNALLEDRYGYLWLATNGKSAVRFDKKNSRFTRPVTVGTMNATALCLDEKGVLWVGRQGGGVLKINTKTLAYETDPRYTNLYAKTVPHVAVSALYRDAANNIWLGSWDKVLYKTGSSKAETALRQSGNPHSFPADDVLSFSEDAQGRLWMGGRHFGLTVYDTRQNRFYNYRNDATREGTVADNQINRVYTDRSGMVWLCTNKGLSVYNPAQEPFVQTFLPKGNDDITIYDFWSDETKNLWIGTSEGLYVQKQGSRDFEHKPLRYNGLPLAVTKFFKDDSTLYLGTNFSLFRYAVLKNRLSLLPNTEQDRVMYNIIDSRVVSIIKDTIEGHPVLIVSPYGHFLTYYDLAAQRWVSRNDTVKKILQTFNLKDNLIRKIYKARNGRIWLATGKTGLGQWQRTPVPSVAYMSSNPEQKGSLNNNALFDIAEDATQNLWISTYGGGLQYFDIEAKTFRHIRATDNLLEGIQTDKTGAVWMIGNGNLHRYDPATNSYTTHRLPDIEKTGGVRGALYKTGDGSLYASGTNYFIHFRPEAVRNQQTLPHVYLTDFKIFNSSYSHLLFQKSISLQHNQNYFTLQFAAPEFRSGGVIYSYMLEGVDQGWMDAGERNIVSYANLEGGDYLFKVRATYHKGSWPDQFTSFRITIIPPVWKRWWFYALAAALIAAGIYAFYRYRINELLKRQAIRNRIAQDLHDNLGSTLSSISVYSQVAKIFNLQQRETELQQTLEKISTTSGEMIAEMSDIVWAINPRNDNMATIIQRMESYAKPLLQAKGIGFQFQYDPAIEAVALPMEQRKNFYLIFKEAVNNALKYSACRHLQVQVQVRQPAVELWVQDDGTGFDVAATKGQAHASLSGNGLENMARRAAEMNGQYAIRSAPGKGTTVHLKFLIP